MTKHLVRGGLPHGGPGHRRTRRAASMKIYNFARDYARLRGIIIADTKYEFGLLEGTSF